MTNAPPLLAPGSGLSSGEAARRLSNNGPNEIRRGTQALFQLGRLSAADCALSILVGFIPVTVLELAKLSRRWRSGPTLHPLGGQA